MEQETNTNQVNDTQQAGGEQQQQTNVANPAPEQKVQPPDVSNVEIKTNGTVLQEGNPTNAGNGDNTAQQQEQQQQEENPANTAQQDYTAMRNEVDKAKETLTEKGVDYAKLEAEYNEKGALSDESYAALQKAGYAKEVVDAVIAGWQAKADKFADTVINSVGGKDAWEQMTKFVQSQGNDAVSAFNNIVANGDMNTIQAYMAGVKAQMVAKYGTSNPTLTGHGVAKGVKGYANQAEMISAMSDKRYGRDAQYTHEVEARLAASNSIF